MAEQRGAAAGIDGAALFSLPTGGVALALSGAGAEASVRVPDGLDQTVLMAEAEALRGTPVLRARQSGELALLRTLLPRTARAHATLASARAVLRAAAFGVEPLRAVPAPTVLRALFPDDPDPVQVCLDPSRPHVVANVGELGPEGVGEVAALAHAFGVRLIIRGDPALAAAHDAALLIAPDAPEPNLPELPPGPRVASITLHRIALPLSHLYVSAMYLTRSQPRLLVEMRLEDGTTGWGETAGERCLMRLVADQAKDWIGRDPLRERALLRRRFARTSFDNRNGRNGLAAFAGLDLAAWDASARLLGLPLAALLGHAGPLPPLPLAAPLPAAVPPEGMEDRAAILRHMQDASNAERVADLAAALADGHGIRAFKWKSAGSGIGWDASVMAELRGRLPSGTRLRHDPNGAHDLDTALSLARRLAHLQPEFLEDPTYGLEAMARMSLLLPVPIATNMAILSPADLAARYRRGAGPQIVLGDLAYWGGVAGLRDMAVVARLIGLTPALHSFYESAVATAAHVHVAAALGLAEPHPMDCGTPGLAADVVPPGTIRIAQGHILVPDGPGLGLAPEPALLRHLATAEPETIA